MPEECPPEIAELVDRCLSFEPKLRPTCQEVSYSCLLPTYYVDGSSLYTSTKSTGDVCSSCRSLNASSEAWTSAADPRSGPSLGSRLFALLSNELLMAQGLH